MTGSPRSEVLALGQDVGIPARYLQQALLEERTRTEPTESRWLDRTDRGGDRHGRPRRPGLGRPQEQALLDWMERDELLQVKRHYPDRTTWEPKGGFRVDAAAASLGGRRSAPLLGTAGSVAATVTPLETGFCHVRLSADVRSTRAAYIGGAAAIVSVGAAATAVLAVLAAFPPIVLVPLPVALAAGSPRCAPTRASPSGSGSALEQVLDRLERRGDRPLPPPPPSMTSVSRAGSRAKALKP